MATQKELWAVVHKHLPTDKWIDLNELYDAVEKEVVFTAKDLNPEAPGSLVPSWKRNVRNVLQQHKAKGAILWNGKAGYRLPDDEKSIARAGVNWSESEVRLTINDYMAMLTNELKGKPYNKTNHRKSLQALLDVRTPGAIERKHQNISAILASLGLPYIDGYKPLGNYQELLKNLLLDYLAKTKEIQDLMMEAAILAPETTPEIDDYRKVLSVPPKLDTEEQEQLLRTLPLIGKKIDYQSREANNRKLGYQGEEFVMRFEKNRLTDMGLNKLVSEVEWVSQTQGDGFGYDIRSFNANGTEIFIEVKTTNRGKEFPFLISANELEISELLGKAYYIYRVFDFSKYPRLFVLNGPVTETCQIRPKVFEARV